jgi:uncharacterized protein (TIGR02271 family)
MPTTQDITSWQGLKLVGSDGEKLGTIDEIYIDDETRQPEWIAVKTGLFGSKVSFVPITDAHRQGDDVAVPFSKGDVKDAPNADADGALSQEEEEALYRHYGYEYSEARSDSGLPAGDRATTGDSGGRFSTDRDRDAVGHDTSGPTTDDAMTRSEEELRVDTARRESGRARLRKYVVTEEQSVDVPVQREEVRIEREPITDANRGAALDGPEISEEEHEVVLHEDVPVVDKQVVPKERVRLDTETVTDDAQVTEQVRKERIDAGGDDAAAR